MYKKFLMIFLIISTVTVFGCSKSGDDPSSGNQAYNFSLKSVDGKTVNLSDFKGKIVIVDFWATWCPPCRKGIPDLIDIQKQYKDKVAVIGISLDSDQTVGNIGPFIKSYGINYPIVYGNQEVVTKYGNINSIPTTFIIDQKGNIVTSYIGLTPKSRFINDITSLLSKS